ncbi:hypothetical protein [Alteromonas gracilis]|uniref:hypothetical protein n=1 Tax=Alteromonas gracilis TaxID=1479524 RepID=UPI0030CDA4F6
MSEKQKKKENLKGLIRIGNCNVDLILGNTTHNTVRYHKSVHSGIMNCSDNPEMRRLSNITLLFGAHSQARLTAHS